MDIKDPEIDHSLRSWWSRDPCQHFVSTESGQGQSVTVPPVTRVPDGRRRYSIRTPIRLPPRKLGRWNHAGLPICAPSEPTSCSSTHEPSRRLTTAAPPSTPVAETNTSLLPGKTNAGSQGGTSVSGSNGSQRAGSTMLDGKRPDEEGDPEPGPSLEVQHAPSRRTATMHAAPNRCVFTIALSYSCPLTLSNCGAARYPHPLSSLSRAHGDYSRGDECHRFFPCGS